MADRDPRFFLPISENYFDLSEAEQEAICLQMAETLIAALASGLLVVISSAWLTALLTPVAFAADA